MSHRFAARAPVVAIAVFASIALLSGPWHEADAATKKTSRKGQAPSQARPAPDVTSTIAPADKSKGAPPSTPAVPEPEDESIPPAFNLPTASRTRMRTCGERWQTMKMSGEARDQTWRSYATKCLASKDGPR